MPHVIVKAIEGKTEEQKKRLADAITQSVTEIFGNDADAVSVAIEEIAPDRWKDDVYRPEIEGRSATLYKPPGYEL